MKITWEMTMKHPVSYDDIFLEISGDKGIYLPSDDTFLLLDLLKKCMAEDLAKENREDLPVLDMGTGTGIISLFLARKFNRIHAIDVNPHAIEHIWKVIAAQGLSGKFILLNSSLLEPLDASRGGPMYFLACFNPPYLPMENDHDDGMEIEAPRDHLKQALHAPSGGAGILLKFLVDVKNFLVPGGHVFFVYSSLSSMGAIDDFLEDEGYILIERATIHLFFEDIFACHVQKKK